MVKFLAQGAVFTGTAAYTDSFNLLNDGVSLLVAIVIRSFVLNCACHRSIRFTSFTGDGSSIGLNQLKWLGSHSEWGIFFTSPDIIAATGQTRFGTLLNGPTSNGHK